MEFKAIFSRNGMKIEFFSVKSQGKCEGNFGCRGNESDGTNLFIHLFSNSLIFTLNAPSGIELYVFAYNIQKLMTYTKYILYYESKVG